jgi:hypothetical protein
MSKKSIFGIISLMVIIILITIALGGTWWTIERKWMSAGEQQESIGNWKLLKGEVIEKSSSGTFKNVVNHDVIRNNHGYDDTVKVYDITLCLMIASLVFAIISLVTLIVRSVKRVAHKIVAIFLIITTIFTAVTPIYFATALPNAIVKDTRDMQGSSPIDSFMGSKDVEGIGTSWGPGYAWYLTIVAFVFVLTTVIVTLLEKKISVLPQQSALISPIQAQCPYCQTTFQITPTKKPFKVKCPSCGKKSMLR